MNRLLFSLVLVGLCLCIIGCEKESVEEKGVLVVFDDSNDHFDLNSVAFDDFNDHFDLNWDILGDNPSNWSLSKIPGTLTITTENGTYTRYRKDYKNIFLIPNPVEESQDFQVTTCLKSFRPVGIWNQAALILWNDEDNNLKFGYQYEDDIGPPAPDVINQCVLSVGIEIEGMARHLWFRAEQEPDNIWLRVIKQGKFCDLFVSTDGESFQPAEVIMPAWGLSSSRINWPDVPVKYVGIYANNGSAINAPTVDASFDFFEVKALTKINDSE